MNVRATPFDLNLLRILLALDRTRHVTRAAESLQMSQSGFSSALARLRRYSNDALFVRTNAGMEPTPYAQRMVDAATLAVSTFEDGVLSQSEFDPSTTRTEFSFALTDLAEMVFLPRLLSHLQRVAPHITVRCESLPEERLQQALSSGQADLALGYFPELCGDVFFHQRLYRHTFACIVQRSHALDRGAMTTAIFRKLGHVEVVSPSRTGRLFESWLQRRGIERHVVLRTPHHLSLPAIIERTDLIATVPLAVAVWFARHGAVKVVPLPFRPGTFDVKQYWHRRYHKDPRHQWLREQATALFNDASDSWHEFEDQLYAKRRRQMSGHQREVPVIASAGKYR